MLHYIINATFGTTRDIKTSPRWRYDYGQKLIFHGVTLPDLYEVHFANDGSTSDAIRVLGDADGVSIPDSLFQTGQNILAWLYLHDIATDGETVYKVTIPIQARARPAEYEPGEDPDVLAQAIAVYNAANGDAQEYATKAESYAVGGTGTRTGEDTDNARYYAEVAQQGAEASGYAWFYIDNSTGEMYVDITDSLSDEISFQINENTGELEVMIA